MVKSSSGRVGYRSFTVVQVGKHGGCKTKFRGGKYVSKAPVSAAMKAFSSFCKYKRIRGVCTLFVTLQETTRGSNGKMYTYKLNRYRLKEPLIRFEGTDKEYVIQYTRKAKAVAVPPSCKKPGQTRGRMLKTTPGAKTRRLRPNNVRKMRNRSARRGRK